MQSVLINWNNLYNPPKVIEASAKLYGYKLFLTRFGFLAAVETSTKDVITGSILEFQYTPQERTTYRLFRTGGFVFKDLNSCGIFIVEPTSDLLKDAVAVSEGDFVKNRTLLHERIIKPKSVMTLGGEKPAESLDTGGAYIAILDND